MFPSRLIVFGMLMAALAIGLTATSAADTKPEERSGERPNQPVDFLRDVRPILANRCFTCHGPDEAQRQSEFRLDVAESALGSVIVAGDPGSSELIGRVASEDPDLRMPPADSGKTQLSPAEVDLLRRWIADGAKYQVHWAYQAPQRPAVPEPPDTGWTLGAIDRFVTAVHAEHGLIPAPPADRHTLLRRLSFDLTGLPPAPAEIAAFENDPAPDAYEKQVERLLASPQYGERMAVYWLDVARYADSGGYHSDNDRTVWLYRDYVIQSFNENKPFDQFVTEQLAGDLLEGATRWQKIASGYNRLLQTTEEGGAQPKEYTAKYASDRVRSTASAFLGATMLCAECHNHKYDPYTMKDYYSFAAFFADVAENAVGRQDQTPMPTDAQSAELARLDAEMAPLRQALAQQTPELDQAQAAWEAELGNRPQEWAVIRPSDAKSEGGATLTVADDGTVTASGTNPEKDVFSLTLPTDLAGVTGLRLETLADPSLPNGGPGRAGNGNFVLNEVEAVLAGQPVKWAAVSADHSQNAWAAEGATDGNRTSGWAILPHTGKPHELVFEAAEDITFSTAAPLVVTLRFEYGSGHAIGKFRIAATRMVRPIRSGASGLPADLAAILATPAETRTAEQREKLAAHYRTVAAALAPVREKLAALEAQKKELESQVPTSLVSMAVAPRTVRMLPRGNWLDDSGAEMQPAIPEFLGKLAVGDRRATRLDLARWLTSRDNPLVARVFVNRLWKLFFGQGIVGTVSDLGTQGDLPTHPQLLDWLAVELIESGWDVKHVVRLMVGSQTYRQSSRPHDGQRESDPTNQFLARQNRFRLDAEFVRDNALKVSGLLALSVGGPSVKPYQPAGYWQHLNFPEREWQSDTGEAQYRRGLYTWWQRTFLHPSLLAFDASTREECTAARARSNTPLQSLVLLNDPTYVEAARAFAARVLREGGASDADRLAFAFREILGRPPQPAEADILSALVAKHREEYRADEASAAALTSVGNLPVAGDLPKPELAAWTAVARTILNLHETITRE